MPEDQVEESPFYGDASDFPIHLGFLSDEGRYWLQKTDDPDVALLAEIDDEAVEYWRPGHEPAAISESPTLLDTRWLPDGIHDDDGLSDSQLEAFALATTTMDQVIQGLLASGWRLRTQFTVSEQRVPRIKVIADPPNDVDDTAIRRVTDMFSLPWGTAELTWTGPPPSKWGDDWQLTEARVAGRVAPTDEETLNELLVIAMVTAPQWTVRPGFDRPVIRHSEGGHMPGTAISVVFDSQVANRSSAEIADLERRAAVWGDKHKFGVAISEPTKTSVQDALDRVGDGISGYYLLGFENGDRYLGQSTNIPARIETHKRERKGITSVRLLPDPEANTATSPVKQLLASERALIHSLQHSGLPTRNKAEMTYWTGHRAVDDIFPPVDATAEDWLNDPVGINQRGKKIPRMHTADLSAGNEAMSKLAERAGERLQQMLAIQRAYLDRCLPLPSQTEYEWWVVSSPLTTPSHGTLTNLSVGWTECLRINTTFSGFIQVNGVELFGEDFGSSGDFDDADAIRFMRQHPGAYVDNAPYSDGGAFNLNIYAPSLEVLADLLDDTAVTRAAATAALNYMRVRKVGAIKNSHNPVLAALLLDSGTATQ